MSRTDMPHADPREDRAITRTDADMDSDTRFGPRPVPEGHRRPSGPVESRRIPPSGPVSPDGSRSYPRPSRSAKWLVWGGTALAAAAATAGTVYAARQIAGLIAGEDRDRPAPPRPQPAAPSLYRQPASARDVPPQDRPVREHPGEGVRPTRSQAPRPKRRKHLMQEIQENTAQLGSTVDGVMQSLGSAVAGFRGVAGQAGAIIREFSDAATLVREILDAKPAQRPDRTARAAAPDAGDDAAKPVDSRMHRL